MSKTILQTVSVFQTALLKRTGKGLQSRFTVKRFCKSFLFFRPLCLNKKMLRRLSSTGAFF